MKSLSKTVFLSITVLLACLVVAAVQLMRLGGVFSTVNPGFAGSCRAIALAGSAGAMQLDRERGLAYLSFRDAGSGTVLLLDLNLDTPAPRAAMSYDPRGFRPEGISLLKQPGQPARLFAVNKAEGAAPAVEISEQDAGGAFVPRLTVRDPAIVQPSLVAGVGPGRFYVVDHRPPQGWWQRQSSLLTRSGDDSIAYYDGTRAVAVVKGLAWASGIALSADGSRLYVAELLTRSLRVYRRNTATAELTLERIVDLGTPPGNLDVDSDGILWITAHPKLLRYIAAADDPGERAPTLVMRLDLRQPDAKPVQVFADGGGEISAGAAAARWRDELLIGAPSDKKVLICKPVH